jgi:hypothetical protein
VALALATVTFAAAACAADDHSALQIERVLEIVPKGVVPNVAGKNPARVGLGSPLVDTRGCNDRHAHPVPARRQPVCRPPERIDDPQDLSGGRTYTGPSSGST